MTGGKPRNYVGMARRRKWVMVLLLVLGGLAGLAVSSRVPGPVRLEFCAAGLIGGFLLALALMFVLEHRDTTLRTDADVVAAIALPVLAVVPAMTTLLEQRQRQRRRRIRLLFTMATIVVAGGVVAAWVVLG